MKTLRRFAPAFVVAFAILAGAAAPALADSVGLILSTCTSLLKQKGVLDASGTFSAGAVTLTTAAQPNVTSLGTLTGLTLGEAANVVLGTTTGTKIGTATTQKLGFFNATPVVQEAGSNDVLASLVTLGLRAASSNPPLNLGSGAITAGNITGTLQTAAQTNVTSLGTVTGLATTGTGQHTWGTGGSPSVSSPNIAGATDADLYIAARAPGSGAGRDAILSAGASTASGAAGGTAHLFGGGQAIASANRAGGAVEMLAGSCTGTTSTGDGGAANCTAGNGGTTSGTGGAFAAVGGNGTGSTSGAGGAASVKGGNGSTGSNNNAAGGVTIGTGIPSGNASADIVLNSGFIGASGASAQAVYDRQRITSKTKALSTTTATNTVFCNLTNAVTDSGVGCTVTGTIELIDGAHHVGTIHFTVPFSSVNQSAALTAGIVPVLSTANGSIDTGGTYTGLTTTFTAVGSGTNLQLGVTPAWSAGTPTTVRLTYQVMANGQATLAPQ